MWRTLSSVDVATLDRSKRYRLVTSNACFLVDKHPEQCQGWRVRVDDSLPWMWWTDDMLPERIEAWQAELHVWEEEAQPTVMGIPITEVASSPSASIELAAAVFASALRPFVVCECAGSTDGRPCGQSALVGRHFCAMHGDMESPIVTRWLYPEEAGELTDIFRAKFLESAAPSTEGRD